MINAKTLSTYYFQLDNGNDEFAVVVGVLKI